MRRKLAAAIVAGALVVGAAVTIAPAFADKSNLELSNSQRQEIEAATKQFKDPEAALAAGYLATDQCVSDPKLGGEGYHYVNPALMGDNIVDPKRPDVLLYEAQPDGKRQLAGVEYIRVDGDQNLTTADDRPFLYGDYPFNGPMLGHVPGMPIHYDLHVYLYKKNPDGTLATWNKKLTCPSPA